MSEKAGNKKNHPHEDPAVQEIKAELEAEVAQTAPEADYKAVIDELNDKLLRAMAEAQNTRRRADIDVQNAKNFATQSFAKDLLGVMDNLVRAAESISDADAASSPQLKNVKDGVEITRREMVSVFERSGIKAVNPMGQAFDPNLHQAISQVPDANNAPGTVLQVLQIGYTLKDRLLRPALVVVSAAG